MSIPKMQDKDYSYEHKRCTMHPFDTVFWGHVSQTFEWEPRPPWPHLEPSLLPVTLHKMHLVTACSCRGVTRSCGLVCGVTLTCGLTSRDPVTPLRIRDIYIYGPLGPLSSCFYNFCTTSSTAYGSLFSADFL